ncbi:MAG: hypothetical protein WBL25_17135 [Anaerolineales bacterium]
MGTTDLFVELIVIGIGAMIWVVLATFSIFGYGWAPLDQLFSVSAIIPFLSIVYIFGIITDRIADILVDAFWTPKLLKKHYSSSKLAREDRRLLYSNNEYLSNLLEYGRSRLRICRGWAFNTILIIIASNFFVATQVSNNVLKTNLFIWLNLLLSFVAFFSWYSWYQLTDTQYRRLKGDAKFLRQGKSTEDKKG